jgi:pimeloyl-ACP methyl ester carboxylesterase
LVVSTTAWQDGRVIRVVLLHGWPGDPGDWRAVIPLLDAKPVVPELLWHPDVSAQTLADRVAGVIDEPAVVGGYDVGSRVAQSRARRAPEKVRALVLAPPLPGAGDRVLTPEAQREFWYQAFHRLELAEQLVDGKRDAVRAYLRHFWTHWSGPGFELPDDELERLTDRYAAPGAFTASLGWYRAGSGTVAMSLAETVPEQPLAQPTHVLWPELDPLFPRAWADRLGHFFADYTLTDLPGAGHFSPLEAPQAWAQAIRAHL